MVLVREQRLNDFTGGLNLRADAYHLTPSESPDMLNVDLDARAGVRSRGGWESTHANAFVSRVQRLHSWLRLSGVVTTVAACEDGKIYQRVGSSINEVLANGSVSFTASASPHIADFIEWDDDLYILCGTGDSVNKWSGVGAAVAQTPSGTAGDTQGNTLNGWQNDYTAPEGGYFPKAEYAVTYAGYMVAANTIENGVRYPNRVRFSHPGTPGSWAALDYFDIEDGGAEITGIVAFDDHVLVFKRQSLLAIYGYSRESFAPVNLAADAGTSHRNSYAVGVQSCYFFSYPDGIMEYIPNEGVKELSKLLRPIIEAGDLNAISLEDVYLGWLNKRLWFGAPYELGLAPPSEPKTVFVLDPQLNAWTRFVGADGSGLGPFATGGGKSADGYQLAYAPGSKFVMAVDRNSTGSDIYGGSTIPMPSYYHTRWFAAGTDSTKKMWRRPTYVFTELDAAYTVDVDVFRNLEDSNRRSTHSIRVDTGSDGSVYNDFDWNDGTIYGSPPTGSRFEKGGSLGLAYSISLKFKGTLGEPWGLNSVINKFKERRLR
jgi:hypothetical protein